MRPLFVAALCLTGTLAANAEGFAAGPPEEAAGGFMFTEGPLWLPDGRLIFSDIPADAIHDGEGAVFRKPSGQSNGLTLDRQGRLIAAEHQTRRVTRTEEDGAITVLAERFEGKRFNSPNDVIVRSDGMIFFTDPPYGLPGGLDGENAELDFSGVYALVPGEEPRLIARDFDRPNGLVLCPAEETLYVADTARDHIRAFKAAADGGLSEDRVYCELPNPDGLKADLAGNIWAAAYDGVRVYSPEGELLETIVFPFPPANLNFGGADGKTLFVTARRGVYRVPVTVAGIHPAALIEE